MLGRNLASLESNPKRLLQSLWGIPDIHTRQKWHTLWPHLRALPRRGVSLLDAGCGSGHWSLELAMRRPDWKITGIDSDRGCLERGDRARQKLGLRNVSFEEADFFEYDGSLCCDVVLSVCSAHTCAEAGRGAQLFEQFHRWLRPGGQLLLLVPRRLCETPFAPWLLRQHWQQVFAREELVDLCAKSHFTIERLHGRIGALGTLAKQIDLCVEKQSRGRSKFLPSLLYPVVWSMTVLDRIFVSLFDRSSLFWLLVARKKTSLMARGVGDGPARSLNPW